MSRWTPLLKDVLEEAVEERLDERRFPQLARRAAAAEFPRAPATARYGHWHKDKAAAQPSFNRNVPRLIVCVLGGVCYSELRVAYEVGSLQRHVLQVVTTHVRLVFVCSF